MEGYRADRGIQMQVINKLYQTWRKYPELRLGQLVACVVKDKDLFVVYDEQFLSMLEAFDNEHTTTTR